MLLVLLAQPLQHDLAIEMTVTLRSRTYLLEVMHFSRTALSRAWEYRTRSHRPWLTLVEMFTRSRVFTLVNTKYLIKILNQSLSDWM